MVNSVSYQLVNGITVANSWEDLTDGKTVAQINLDETGTLIAKTDSNGNEILVFTHTDSFGQSHYRDRGDDTTCREWKSNRKNDRAKAATHLK